MRQRELAEQLRALHQPGDPLILVNAWDAASARVVVHAGARAVATSSAAAAYVAGYPDGQNIPLAEMLDAVATITRAVSVPVTADMEAGFGDTPAAAAAAARGVIGAGAVGLNIEDTTDPRGLMPGLLPIESFVEKIHAIRDVAEHADVPLVLNARVDVFIAEVGPEETRVERTIERGRAYLEAGADCIFVPAVTDKPTIAALVHEIGGCVSILATPRTPTLAELARLGVARVSMGSGPYRASLTATLRIAEEAYGMGTFAHLAEAEITHADAQELMR